MEKQHGIKKRATEDIQLTHSCFKCPARFSNSSHMLQHMREEHMSFVEQANSKIPRNPLPGAKNNVAAPTQGECAAGSSYKNVSALCPFCSEDCHTRKKLMRHLELEHKDDNEHEDEGSYLQPKLVRLDSNRPRITGNFDIQEMQKGGPLKKSLGAVNLLSKPGVSFDNSSMENSKTGGKLQYKCFWCDASFRKRGKLMDHIDLLHKHNKQQNQVEAEMLNLDEPSKHTSSPISRSPAPTLLPFSQTASSLRAPYYSHSELDSSHSRAGHFSRSCSFQILGSLSKNYVPQRCKLNHINSCKFYYGKLGNPLVNVRPGHSRAPFRQSSSFRYSSLNTTDDYTQSHFMYPYGMVVSQNSMTIPASLPHNYFMGVGGQPLVGSGYYPHHRTTAMTLPCYMNNTSAMQSSQASHTQLLTRLGAETSTDTNHSSKVTDVPLDLSKAYS